MRDWFEILASLLGRLALIGVIITLFSLGVTFAESRGMNFPAVVSEWNSAALVLGLVLIAVEVVLLLFRGVSWFFKRVANRIYSIGRWRRQNREAIQNLRTIDEGEFELLFRLLRSGEKRFQVASFSSASTLIQKDILVFIKPVSASLWICELNGAIELHRDQIMKSMEIRAKQLGL